jgi:hypothetical protein
MSKQNTGTLGCRLQRIAVIVASVCLLLCALAGCEPDLKTVEKTTDQDKLARIAVKAELWGVRKAAGQCHDPKASHYSARYSLHWA